MTDFSTINKNYVLHAYSAPEALSYDDKNMWVAAENGVFSLEEGDVWVTAIRTRSFYDETTRMGSTTGTEILNKLKMECKGKHRRIALLADADTPELQKKLDNFYREKNKFKYRPINTVNGIYHFYYFDLEDLI